MANFAQSHPHTPPKGGGLEAALDTKAGKLTLQEERGLTGLPAMERAAFVWFMAHPAAREITHQYAHIGAAAGGPRDNASASVITDIGEASETIAPVPADKSAELMLEPPKQLHLEENPTATAAPDGEEVK